MSIFILIYRKTFYGILLEILSYNRQDDSGDASVRLNLGRKEWKVLSSLICQMGTHSKTSNVLMRIFFVFSPPSRSIKETLLQRNGPLSILKFRNGRKNTTGYYS